MPHRWHCPGSGILSMRQRDLLKTTVDQYSKLLETLWLPRRSQKGLQGMLTL